MASDILNRLILNGNKKSLDEILEKLKIKHSDVDHIKSVDDWDHIGNPPLHLAILTGQVDMAKKLIDSGASCLSVNSGCWTALEEAIILGNRELLEKMIPSCFNEQVDRLTSGTWSKFNDTCPDFDITLEFKLKSPIPGIAAMCPKEKVRVRKSQKGVRFDWNVCKVKGFKLYKAPMSLLLSIDGNKVDAYIVNHQEKTCEEIFPNVSQNIIHDWIESFLEDGIISDEMPIEDYVVERVKSNGIMGKKDKTKKISRTKVETEVFDLKNLGWRQRIRYATDVSMKIEPCSEKCRNVPLQVHVKHSVDLETKKDFVSLEALQYISETDLFESPENIVEDLSSDEEAENSTTDPTPISLTDRLRNLMLQTKPKVPNREQEPTTVKKEENFHFKSFDEPVNRPKTTDDYFSQKFDRLGRECYVGMAKYERDLPVRMFMTNEYPIKLEHFVPLAEWLLERVAPPAGIRKLVAALPGFPARIEVPIIPSVKLRATVLSCDSKSNLEEGDLKVPAGYNRDDIFPIFDE